MYDKVQFWSGDPQNRVIQLIGENGQHYFYLVSADGPPVYGYPAVHLHKQYRITLFTPLPGGSPVTILEIAEL